MFIVHLILGILILNFLCSLPDLWTGRIHFMGSGRSLTVKADTMKTESVFGSKESVLDETEVEQNEGVKTTLETTKRRHVQKLLNGMSDNDFEASTVSRTMNDTSPFSSPIDWSSRSGSRTRHALYSTCASCW